jgi:hypothetical protein
MAMRATEGVQTICAYRRFSLVVHVFAPGAHVGSLEPGSLFWETRPLQNGCRQIGYVGDNDSHAAGPESGHLPSFGAWNGQMPSSRH